MGIADAPWIRDAEINGMEDCPQPICPVCGAVAESIFLVNGSEIGCDFCVETKDAYDWMFEKEDQ